MYGHCNDWRCQPNVHSEYFQIDRYLYFDFLTHPLWSWCCAKWWQAIIKLFIVPTDQSLHESARVILLACTTPNVRRKQIIKELLKQCLAHLEASSPEYFWQSDFHRKNPFWKSRQSKNDWYSMPFPRPLILLFFVLAWLAFSLCFRILRKDWNKRLSSD